MVLGITARKATSKASSGGDGFPAGLAVKLQEVEAEARRLSSRFAALEARDMEAFEGFLAALRLPRSTEEEKARRQEARADAARKATEVPLEMLRTVEDLLVLSQSVVDLSSTTRLKAESDLGAAVELAHAAARVSALNIGANLPFLSAGAREEAQSSWRALEGSISALVERLRARLAAE
jgi:formiminotetrahydrofolate cyclodeaminase